MIAAVIISIGLFNDYRTSVESFTLSHIISEFYSNLGSEFLGIGITVIIIEGLNRRREKERLKQQLIREMSSNDNGFAVRAVRELCAEGWHKDGTLRGINCKRADLTEADLTDADMEQANFTDAKLVKTILSNTKLMGAILNQTDLKGSILTKANLSGAQLRDADLEDAILVSADLKGANLLDANLKNCDLTRVKCDENTKLPDGQFWNTNIDMKYFTDPKHKDFWRSPKDYSPAHDDEADVENDHKNETPYKLVCPVYDRMEKTD
ncbi:MAG: pentapeptide repeat-containing protein [Chloroflexi bacterium]|nr:MAG: pentapeptide repeat-containing protein [Chloroflexota bacterium]